MSGGSDEIVDILSIHQNVQNGARSFETEEELIHFDLYLVQAIPLVREFQSIVKQRGKVQFTGSFKSTTDNIHRVVSQYLKIARAYYPEWCDVDNTMTPHVVEKPAVSRNTCSHTHLIMSGDNTLVCEKCGFTPDFHGATTPDNISFKDINRVNLASKYLYDRIIHFKDCINQFQGKQNCTIDEKVFNDLIEQFRSHDLIPENHRDLPKTEAFSKITKEHIMLFLKECKHSKHYEDVVLIHSMLTGIRPPDITHLENHLLRDFDILTTLYDKKYKQADRKNFINTQYVLYQLLKRHKFPCRKEDFNILKTIDRKFYHDDICKSLFEELQWNFNPTF